MQADYGTENLVVLYWHVSDSYATTEGEDRANSYGVYSIPEVDFDAVEEVTGGGPGIRTVYDPIYATRHAEPTPITIESYGVIGESGGWVTATFRAVEAVSYDSLTAYFVAIEEVSEELTHTVREVAEPEWIQLSSAGDSVVVSRNFDVTWGPKGDLDVVVFLEASTPREIVNANFMPNSFRLELAASQYASEMGYSGTAVYSATLRNTGTMADTATVEIAHDDLPDGVGPADWPVSYREEGGGWRTAPHPFALDPGEEITLEIRLEDLLGTTPGLGVATLSAESRGNPDLSVTASFATFVEYPSILIVDDDGGLGHETYLETAVHDTGYVAHTWNANARGKPGLAQLSSYWAVLWTTANRDASDITSYDEQNMASYLEGGGNLMLASMEFLSSRTDTSVFITDYMHIDSWSNDTSGFTMTGVGGDEISDGMSLLLIGGPFPPSKSDAVDVSGPAEVIFTGPQSTGNKGIKVRENGHSLVFLAFPFEDVKTTAAAPSNQKTLVGRILAWFETSTGVEDTVGGRLVLEQNAPNPFNPKTSISFTVPGGASSATLTVYTVGGRLVKMLHDGPLGPGRHTVAWDGKDAGGARLASGIYFARLAADGEVAFRKMTLLK